MVATGLTLREKLDLRVSTKWNKDFLPKRLPKGAEPYDELGYVDDEVYHYHLEKRRRREEKLYTDEDMVEKNLSYFRKYINSNNFEDSFQAILYFIESNVYIEDPESSDHVLRVKPFILFKQQKKFLREIHYALLNRKSLVVCKSRNVGASWVGIAYMVTMFLFQHNFKGILLSNLKENVVASHNTDALLSKVRFIIDKLPRAFKPNQKDGAKSGSEASTATEMRNFDNGSIIVGKYGREAGRSGRAMMAFFDEFDFLDDPNRVEAAMSAVCQTRIYVSTVNKRDGLFYKMVQNRTHKTIFLTWFNEERYNRLEWVQKKMSEYADERIFHKEYNFSFEFSEGNNMFQWEWLMSAIDSYKKLNMKPIPNETVCGYDVALTGDANVFVLDNNGIVLKIIHKKEPLIDNLLPMIPQFMRSYKIRTMFFDVGATCGGTILGYFHKNDVGYGELYPVNVGAKCNNPVDYYSNQGEEFGLEGINAGDESLRSLHRNIRYQLYLLLSERFKNTYLAIQNNGSFDDLGNMVCCHPAIAGLPQSYFISLPDDEEVNSLLFDELLNIVYIEKTNQRFIIPKQELRGLLGRSPDTADALSLAGYDRLVGRTEVACIEF